MIPSQEVNNSEAITKLRVFCSEHKVNAVKLKLKRQLPGQVLRDPVAHFDAAEIRHFESPEVWVDKMAGGGTFFLEAVNPEDPTEGPIGATVVFQSSAPIRGQGVPPLDVEVTKSLEWRGPLDLRWSPERAPLKSGLVSTAATGVHPPPNGAQLTPANEAKAEAARLEERRQALEKQERELEVQKVRAAADQERKRVELQLEETKKQAANLERRLEDERADNKRALDALNMKLEALLAKPVAAPPEDKTAGLLVAMLQRDQDRAAAEAETRRREAKEERERQEAREDRLRSEAKEEARDRREREDRIDKERREERAALEAAKRESDAKLLALLTAPKPANPQIEGMEQVLSMATKTITAAAQMSQMALDIRNMNAGEDDSDLVKVGGMITDLVGKVIEKAGPGMFAGKGTIGALTGAVSALQLPQQTQTAAGQPQRQPAPAPPQPLAEALPPLSAPLQRVADAVRSFTPVDKVWLILGEEAHKSMQSSGSFHTTDLEVLFGQISPHLTPWYGANAAKAQPYLLELDGYIKAQELASAKAEADAKAKAAGTVGADGKPAPAAAGAGITTTIAPVATATADGKRAPVAAVPDEGDAADDDDAGDDEDGKESEDGEGEDGDEDEDDPDADRNRT